MLDLNVIADMEDVVLGKSTLEETGLDKVISMLNRTRGLFLVPGFAFHEPPKSSSLASKLAAYELFSENILPNLLRFARFKTDAFRSAFGERN
jgi:hypothetical protein